MKTFKDYLGSILVCLFIVLVGVLLIIDPVEFISIIISIFGWVMLVVGIICAIRYFALPRAIAALAQTMLRALVSISVGLFCIIKTDVIIGLLPALTVVFGVLILFEGFAEIQLMLDLIRFKRGKWALPLIGALLSIICACIIFTNPFTTTTALWIFTGVVLILEAAVAVVMMFIRCDFDEED